MLEKVTRKSTRCIPRRTHETRVKVPKHPPGVPRPVDIHVGRRVRLRRTLLGLSQENLGDAVGLTFQQIQKYERGANRMGASRLFEFSRILDVPVSFFFDDMDDATNASRPGDRLPATLEKDPLARRETLELVRAYYAIADPKVRKRLFEMTKALAGADVGESETRAAV